VNLTPNLAKKISTEPFLVEVRLPINRNCSILLFTWRHSLRLVLIPEGGVLIPLLFFVCLNNFLSSSFLMALSFSLISSMSHFYNAPLSANVTMRLSVLWQPMFGKRMLIAFIREPAPPNVTGMI